MDGVVPAFCRALSPSVEHVLACGWRWSSYMQTSSVLDFAIVSFFGNHYPAF